MQRVDKLEQENTQLKSENEALKATDEKLEAQDDYLKAEARGLRKEAAQQAAEVSKVKGADWAGKVAVTGDMRYRYEMISDETLSGGVQTADRYRDRIRARLAATAKATDNITVGIGMTTTEGQRSALGQSKPDRRVLEEAARSRSRVFRLEVRQLGRPDRRQDEAAVREAGPEPVLGQRHHARKAWR